MSVPSATAAHMSGVVSFGRVRDWVNVRVRMRKMGSIRDRVRVRVRDRG